MIIINGKREIDQVGNSGRGRRGLIRRRQESGGRGLSQEERGGE